MSVLVAVLFVFCSLAAWQACASADPSPLIVSSSNDSGPGTMRQAILDANNTAGDFKIIIAVDGTLTTTSALPQLQVFGRSGRIQSKPGVTITGFSCAIQGDGNLTLEHVFIDDSAYGFPTITVLENATLLLSGSNRITGSVSGYRNMELNGSLTIDKTPGSSDMESTLTLLGTSVGILGDGSLLVKGGTIESQGEADGIMLRAGLLMTGGKLLATGGYCGISQSPLHVASGFVISGGTIVARGDSCDMYNSLGIVINGGSVDARKFSIFPPKGADGNPVYLVTVTVGEQAVTNRQVECTVNDGEAFACCTDAQGKLYLWMPEGQGGADVNVDGTVYRASGPVAATFDNTMLAKAGSIVTGVVVTPSYTTALTGGTVQYSARVEGLYNPPQSVTWKVENGHPGTSILNTGLLRIAQHERSMNLLVTATSTFDPGKSAAAQVGVLSVTGIIVGMVLLFLLVVLLAVFLEVRNPFRR